MVDRLFQLALVGGEPILWLLIFLSLISITVVIERGIFYLRNRISIHAFTAQLIENLNKGEIANAISLAKGVSAAEARVVEEGLNNIGKGRMVVSELMDSMALKQQQALDRWLIILGTIGSNAPFIGLLGTVLGIIQAFHDLSIDSQGGPSVVMSGIAEALVATAVGLLVAIPAVVFFNYFKNRQKGIIGNINQLEGLILAFVDSDVANGPGE